MSWRLCCLYVVFTVACAYHFENEENTNLNDEIRNLVAQELYDEGLLNEEYLQRRLNSRFYANDEVEERDLEDVRMKEYNSHDEMYRNFDERSDDNVLLDTVLEDRDRKRQSDEKLCLNLDKSTTKSSYVRRIIAALERLITHFEAYSDQLIADGLFGLRFAEGVLQKLVHKLDERNAFYNQLHLTYERLRKLAGIAYKKTMSHKKHYDLQFGAILSQPYNHFWSMKSLKSLEHHIVRDGRFFY